MPSEFIEENAVVKIVNRIIDNRVDNRIDRIDNE